MQPSLPEIALLPFDGIVIHDLEVSRGVYPSSRQHECSPADVGRIRDLLGKLVEAEQSRCHIPPFQIDLKQAGAIVVTASICWMCNNIHMSGPLATQTGAVFDDRSAAAQDLLALCRARVARD